MLKILLSPTFDPAEGARRELLEEVGLVAHHLQLISEYYTAVGFSTERTYIYLATDLSEAQARPEVDEKIEIICMSVPKVKNMLNRGEFEDSKTIIGLREALIRLDELHG